MITFQRTWTDTRPIGLEQWKKHSSFVGSMQYNLSLVKAAPGYFNWPLWPSDNDIRYDRDVISGIVTEVGHTIYIILHNLKNK